MKTRLLVLGVLVLLVFALVAPVAAAMTNSEALALLNETNLASLQALRDTLAQLGENLKIAGCMQGVAALCP